MYNHMVRPSNHFRSPSAVLEADLLVTAIKAFQDAVDRFDAAAAANLGVNETDLRCLTSLHDNGPRRPSEIADLLGLTRGATTTAIRRLETAGYLERMSNEGDGRSHLVRLTTEAQKRLQRAWQPIRARGAEHLAQYSVSQLRFLKMFMDRSVALHQACCEAMKQTDDEHRDVRPAVLADDAREAGDPVAGIMAGISGGVVGGKHGTAAQTRERQQTAERPERRPTGIAKQRD